MLFDSDGTDNITVWNAEGFGSPALPTPDYAPEQPGDFNWEAFRDTLVEQYRASAFDPWLSHGEHASYAIAAIADGFSTPVPPPEPVAEPAPAPAPEPVPTVTVGEPETISIGGGGGGGGYAGGGFGGGGGFIGGGFSGGGGGTPTVTVGQPETVETEQN